MSHKKPFKLLCLMDYNTTTHTGFGRVGDSLIGKLRRHYGDRLWMDIVAINYFGQEYKTHNDQTAVLPAQKMDPSGDPFGRTYFLSLLKQYDYDGIFMIHDLGTIMPIVELLESIKAEKKQQNQKTFKSIYYFPIDGVVLPRWMEKIDFFDSIVTYTDYGKQEILKVRFELISRIRVIPHGVNTKHFLPLDPQEKQEFRNAYFKDNTHKKIIGVFNRNQPRKDIPTAIFSFIQYKELFNPQSFLYLHMDPEDPLGWHLRTILSQTFLKEGIDYQFPSESIETIDVNYLNCIYNACDCFLNTSVGEGWGLSVTESFACGLPVVAGLHTAIKEQAGGDSERMWGIHEEHFNPYVIIGDNAIRDQLDYRTAALYLDFCLNQPEKTDVKIKLAYQYAQSLTWDNVFKKWLLEFKKYF